MNYKIAILSLIAVQAYTTLALPPCTCTRNLRPVCGSDGQTYSNDCLLDCARHNGKTDLVIAKEGTCEPDTPTCICTYEYKPVCGTDGETYPNRCALLCQRSAHPDIDVVNEGECQPKVEQPQCICPLLLDPVCGTDGNSYDNDCLLNCATAKNSQLGIKHKGQCSNKVQVAEPMLADQSLCPCPRNMKPVCGSDGVTYNNECLLKCNRSHVTLARSGAC